LLCNRLDYVRIVRTRKLKFWFGLKMCDNRTLCWCSKWLCYIIVIPKEQVEEENWLMRVQLETAVSSRLMMVFVCLCHSCDVYCTACKKAVMRPVMRMRLDVFLATDDDLRLRLSVSIYHLHHYSITVMTSVWKMISHFAFRCVN